MCACTEPVRTGIGAVCVEYRRPKWPITMLNHTHTEECFVFYFWRPMLVRLVMKRLFFPWKTKEKKARFARAPHDDTDHRLLTFCRGVRVAGDMYAPAGMRMHSFSLCQGKCTAVCSIASEQSIHHRKHYVNTPPARAQEHKRRKAHTYQNTTHGAASCIIRCIWYPLVYPLFIISFFLLVTRAAS